MTRSIEIVVEEHPDTFVAYALGLPGVVVGEGDISDAAFADLVSAIRFHRDVFDRPIERIGARERPWLAVHQPLTHQLPEGDLVRVSSYRSSITGTPQSAGGNSSVFRNPAVAYIRVAVVSRLTVQR